MAKGLPSHDKKEMISYKPSPISAVTKASVLSEADFSLIISLVVGIGTTWVPERSVVSRKLYVVNGRGADL